MYVQPPRPAMQSSYVISRVCISKATTAEGGGADVASGLPGEQAAVKSSKAMKIRMS
jgi:hypothetical protein